MFWNVKVKIVSFYYLEVFRGRKLLNIWLRAIVLDIVVVILIPLSPCWYCATDRRKTIRGTLWHGIFYNFSCGFLNSVSVSSIWEYICGWLIMELDGVWWTLKERQSVNIRDLQFFKLILRKFVLLIWLNSALISQ